jgi:hypothetical protein
LWLLSEEHKLKEFENIVLRRIFGPKRNEDTEGLNKQYNEKINILYSSRSTIRMTKWRRMRWGGDVA